MDQELDNIRNKIKNKRHNIHNISIPKHSKKWLFRLMSECLITIVLTLIILIVLKVNPGLKEHFYTLVYENNFSFTTFNNIYNKWFGDILPFGKNKTKDNDLVFKENLVFTNIDAYKDGAKLTVVNHYLIPILESGLVLFIGNKDDYNTCAIVQGSSGMEIWYCNVTNLNIKLYDYVDKGTLLGETTNTTLYLLYKKNGEVLDYKEYIK